MYKLIEYKGELSHKILKDSKVYEAYVTCTTFGGSIVANEPKPIILKVLFNLDILKTLPKGLTNNNIQIIKIDDKIQYVVVTNYQVLEEYSPYVEGRSNKNHCYWHPTWNINLMSNTLEDAKEKLLQFKKRAKEGIDSYYDSVAGKLEKNDEFELYLKLKKKYENTK